MKVFFDLAAIILGSIAGILVTGIPIITVLTIVANWQIFTKAGERGWKSLIPIYGTYICFKISWGTAPFFRNIIAIIVGSAAYALYTQSPETSTGAMISGIVVLIMALWVLIINVKAMYYLSKSFGHGFWFFIGLIFLNTLFVLVLGFEKSGYVGPRGYVSKP